MLKIWKMRNTAPHTRAWLYTGKAQHGKGQPRPLPLHQPQDRFGVEGEALPEGCIAH